MIAPIGALNGLRKEESKAMSENHKVIIKVSDENCGAGYVEFFVIPNGQVGVEVSQGDSTRTYISAEKALKIADAIYARYKPLSPQR